MAALPPRPAAAPAPRLARAAGQRPPLPRHLAPRRPPAPARRPSACTRPAPLPPPPRCRRPSTARRGRAGGASWRALYPDRRRGAPARPARPQWFATSCAVRPARRARPFRGDVPGLGDAGSSNQLVAVPGRSPRRDRRHGAPRRHRRRARRERQRLGHGGAGRARALVRLGRRRAAVSARSTRSSSSHGRRRGRRPRRAALRRTPPRARSSPRSYLDALAGAGRRGCADRRHRAALASPRARRDGGRSACSSRRAGARRSRARSRSSSTSPSRSASTSRRRSWRTGIPAVTLTTGGERPPSRVRRPAGPARRRAARPARPRGAAAPRLARRRALELAPGTTQLRLLRPADRPGWAIELVLIAALLPFLRRRVDLFARCRRRRIPLAPALRSYRSRARLLALGGRGPVRAVRAARRLADGAGGRRCRPVERAAGDWPRARRCSALLVLVGARLARRARRGSSRARPVDGEEELAGHTAALLALGRRRAARRRDEPLRASSCCRRSTPGSGCRRCAARPSGRARLVLGGRLPRAAAPARARSRSATGSASTRPGTSLELTAIGYVEAAPRSRSPSPGSRSPAQLPR